MACLRCGVLHRDAILAGAGECNGPLTHEERIALIFRQMPWGVQSFANIIYPAYRWSGVLTGGYMFPQQDCGGYRASSKTSPYSGVGHKFMRDTDVLDECRDYADATRGDQIARDVAEALARAGVVDDTTPDNGEDE
jgi:hypothetical protein